MKKSPLEKERASYIPKLPSWFMKVHELDIDSPPSTKKYESMVERFPNSAGQVIVNIVPGPKENAPLPLRVGVLLSGGQAPGGHNVICALFEALKLWHKESALLGFLHGTKGLIENRTLLITPQMVKNYLNLGGFDMIGAGRTRIESEAHFEAAAQSCQEHRLDALVIIGGDDSNTNAALLAEAFMGRGVVTKVVGVPKTIDGDLKNAYIECSFGFDTATKIYSEMIGNLAKDTLSAKKYTHFVKLMGRSASHVTLECALTTQPNMAFIAEEVELSSWSLEDLVNQVTDLVEERSRAGKNYGVILVPEGLIEFIPECKVLMRELGERKGEGVESLSEASKRVLSFLPEAISKQFLYDRDAHGNMRLSQIETEKLLIELVKRELVRRKFEGHFDPLSHFFGYEGRSGLPSNFDATYCYALGFCAFALIKGGCTGYMATIQNLAKPSTEWRMRALPLVALMHREERQGEYKYLIAKKLVELDKEPFVTFAKEREGWRLSDEYLSPGPIQFWGKNCDLTTLTLQLESSSRSKEL